MAMMADDAELLAAWHDGDEGAGAELFSRYFDAVYRFFSSKVIESEVEELTQNTFLGCMEARERFRGDSDFRAYLYGIARNKLLHHLRSKKRTPHFDALDSCIRDLEPSASTIVAERAEQRILLEALRSIPIDLQIAVELHYWEGLSGRALGEVLGIPEGTVRSRLRRARTALEARIAEIADSPELLRSTTTDLTRWAASLRELV